jgi:hypothetical protein
MFKSHKEFRATTNGLFQSVIRLSLDTGDYVCYFEPNTPKNNNAPYCARIFYDQKLYDI